MLKQRVTTNCRPGQSRRHETFGTDGHCGSGVRV